MKHAHFCTNEPLKMKGEEQHIKDTSGYKGWSSPWSVNSNKGSQDG